MPSVEFVGFENLEIQLVGNTTSAVNEVLKELKKHLQEEAPVNKGKLRKSIRIIPAKYNGGIIVGGVSIGDNLDYVAKVIYGSAENERYHFAPKVMKFDDWDGGPDELRAADGFFYFRRVKHNIPPNNFVNRALAKMDYRRIKRIFEEKIRKAILKGK
jgi:hypothetical protein